MKTVRFLILILLVSVPGMADVITLEWDANTESDLAGYALYMHGEGQDYDYNNPIAIVPAGTETVTVNVPDNRPLYFVVRAYSTSDGFSGDSNEENHNNDTTPPDKRGVGVSVQ